MLLSKVCESALQAIIYLGIQPIGRPILGRDMARALRLPSPFLGKILQVLSVAVLGLIQRRQTGALLAVPVSPLVYEP